MDASSPFVFSVAFRMLGEQELATDIVQETMITVWRSIKGINSSGSYKTWLYRIVINKCYDELRRKKINPELLIDPQKWGWISETLSHNPVTPLENNEIAQIISLLTFMLSPRQKAVFILAYLEELSNEEISAVTGMSRTRVKANLYHARKKIGEMINKYL